MSKKVISAMYISSSDSDDNTLTETFNENLHSSIPKASLRRAPKYKCSQFRITVQPRIYQIELEREDFFNSIKKDFEDVETIVSKETNMYSSKFRSKNLFKIFIDFGRSKFTSNEVYTYINKIMRESVGNEIEYSPEDEAQFSDNDKRPEIILESVKSKKNSVVWATMDFSPRFTTDFDPNEFSEGNRIHNWAKENVNEKFSLDMPFVQKSRFSAARLRAYHEEYVLKNHVKFELKLCNHGPFNDWRDLAIEWWNGWVKDGWYHKRPQLLIVSPPNCGKTTFVREALFNQGTKDEIPSEAIMIPERAGCNKYITNFAWQKANPSYHAVVFCDEFDIRHYNLELLKIILQGDAFTPIKKHQVSGDDICLRIPMIFTSNHSIPDINETIGLKERFLIIEVPISFKTFTPRRVNKGFYSKKNFCNNNETRNDFPIHKNDILNSNEPKESSVDEIPVTKKLDGSMRQLSLHL